MSGPAEERADHQRDELDEADEPDRGCRPGDPVHLEEHRDER